MSSAPYTTAIDVWSTGCILAELFGRKPLFQGNSIKEQIGCIIQVTGCPLPEEIAQVDPEVSTRKKLIS